MNTDTGPDTGIDAEKSACPLRFDIGGMHCAACSSRIERVVGRMEGVDKISVNLAAASAEVWPRAEVGTGAGDGAELQKQIMERVAALGFTATPAVNDDAARQFEENKAKAAADIHARLRRLLPMAAFAVPLLVISMGHMLAMDFGLFS